VSPTTTDYERLYSEIPDAFGPDPDPLLIAEFGRLDRSQGVLDVGCGQGRNLLFLARNGYAVEGIDPSQAAVEATRAAAGSEGLAVPVHRTGFDGFVPDRPFGSVLLFGLFPDLSRDEIERLVTRSWGWLTPGGRVFVTAFTVDDPSYPYYRDEGERVGGHSYLHPGSGLRTFLELGELSSVFDGWSVEYMWEGFGPAHRHGKSLPERHAKAHGVFSRKES